MMQIHVKPSGLRRAAIIGAAAAAIAGLASPALAQSVRYVPGPGPVVSQPLYGTVYDGRVYNGYRGAYAQEWPYDAYGWNAGPYGARAFECRIDDGYGRTSSCTTP